MNTEKKKPPILFLPHGGGPLPLLGDPGHRTMVQFIEGISKKLDRPKAILVISGHWEEGIASITSAATSSLIYDYSGFPRESYEIKYPAPGDPELSGHVQQLLKEAGIKARLDSERGFDHGVFVPLKLLYPDATIPVVQISLLNSYDPQDHINLGKALSALRSEGILIVGSGMSFHNMRAFFSPGIVSKDQVDSFYDYLLKAVGPGDLSEGERNNLLVNWEEAPFARLIHPREEHLLPLHVCFGAADLSAGKIEFDDLLVGQRCIGVVWD